MSKIHSILCAALLVGAAACQGDGKAPTSASKGSVAQPKRQAGPDVGAPSAPPRSGHRRGGLGWLLDTDGDGTLSKAELQGAPGALLKLDANGDGELTADELPARRRWRRKGARRGGGPGMGGQRPWRKRRGLFGKLDVDGDGKLSKAEIAGAAKALLSLDANGDGVLSIDEIRPHRRRWRGMHGGRGWRGGMGGGRGWRGGMGGGRGWRGGMGGGPGGGMQGGGMQGGPGAVN